jgi:hypothetical protein
VRVLNLVWLLSAMAPKFLEIRAEDGGQTTKDIRGVFDFV